MDRFIEAGARIIIPLIEDAATKLEKHHFMVLMESTPRVKQLDSRDIEDATPNNALAQTQLIRTVKTAGVVRGANDDGTKKMINDDGRAGETEAAAGIKRKRSLEDARQQRNADLLNGAGMMMSEFDKEHEIMTTQGREFLRIADHDERAKERFMAMEPPIKVLVELLRRDSDMKRIQACARAAYRMLVGEWLQILIRTEG